MALDEAERYAGIVLLAEAHAPELDEKAAEPRVDGLLRYTTRAAAGDERQGGGRGLRPAEADALAVVDGPDGRQVLGLLTEAHVLRRYAEELDRRRRSWRGRDKRAGHEWGRPAERNALSWRG